MTTRRIAIDLGGTFVDVASVDRWGSLRTVKGVSDPNDLVGSVLRGLEVLASSEGTDVVEALGHTATIVHGTTIATNSVLTRVGAEVGLITTAGTRDALEMRRGIKEEPLNNRYIPPPVLATREHRLGVDGRVTAEGRVVEAPDEAEIAAAVKALVARGVQSIAVCMMHSYLDPSHEQIVGAYLREHHPSLYTTISSELLPRIGFYERTSTAVLNSFVGPRVDSYLNELEQALREHGFSGSLLVMTSAGGLLRPDQMRKRAAAALLSGPAAGPLAPIRGHSGKVPRACTVIDIGGTSLDVSIVSGGRTRQVQGGSINGYAIGLPMIDVVTVGSGGGSIAWVDDANALRIGPHSAGALPGPACYGFGGASATVTDAAMVLGRIDESSLRAKEIPADKKLAEEALQRDIGDRLGLDVEESAIAVFRVAVALMAESIRNAVTQRGKDPRDAPLFVGGGAGPIHADALAASLGATDVYLPVYSASLCAVGLLCADLRHEAVRTCWAPLAEVSSEQVASLVDSMRREARDVLGSDEPTRMQHELRAYLQYSGQLEALAVDVDGTDWSSVDHSRLVELFHLEHERVNGYVLGDQSLELVSLTLSSSVASPAEELWAAAPSEPVASASDSARRRAYLFDEDEFRDLPVLTRAHLGEVRAGPFILDIPDSSLLVPPGCAAALVDGSLIHIFLRSPAPSGNGDGLG